MSVLKSKIKSEERRLRREKRKVGGAGPNESTLTANKEKLALG